MAVPDTNTFSFNDVKSNVTGSPDDLVQAFANATPALFDPAYSGAKESLLNFRNYGASSPVLTQMMMTNIGQGSGLSACSGTLTTLRWHDSPGIVGVGDRVYSDSGGTTPFNGGNLWFKTSYVTSVRIDTSGYVTSELPC